MPLNEAKELFEKERERAIEWLQHEAATLRSNRVGPDLVSNLPVEAYGSRNPLQTIASITSSDARTLVVSPYDKNTIRDIEKAITNANLGVQPNVDGEIVRLIFPSMTDEVRQQTIKLLHNKAEETRVKLRQARDEALRMLKQEKEKSDITEDDFYYGKEELDEMISKTNDTVADIVKRKETDIATI